MTYRTLKRQFELDDAALEDLKEELIYGQRLAADEDERVLVWMGDTAAPTPPASDALQPSIPARTCSPHLHTAISGGEILTSRSALEGERKQVTVLFADLKGSMELLADRDPEEARQLLDPVLEHDGGARYEGTVNQVMGDGIMALFGAPLAHEDHAVRACYAALGMQAAAQQYATEVQRTHGVPLQMRVGLNAGEVVVRAIGNDLHMDYSAIGQTTHLAARMEQMAMPGSILITPAVLGLAEGYVQVRSLGPVPVRGLDAPVEVFELAGRAASGGACRLQQCEGSRALSAGTWNSRPWARPWERAGARRQVGRSSVRLEWGSPAWCTSVRSPRTQGWLVLESASVSYGKATPYWSSTC